MESETRRGMWYRWYLAGADGAAYILYPARDYNTQADIPEAKAYVRRHWDVVSIRIEWIPSHAHPPARVDEETLTDAEEAVCRRIFALMQKEHRC